MGRYSSLLSGIPHSVTDCLQVSTQIVGSFAVLWKIKNLILTFTSTTVHGKTVGHQIFCPLAFSISMLSFFKPIHCRHLKQLGLGGDDSSFLRLTLGLAILAVGGIYAFRFFSNMRCSLLEIKQVKYYLGFFILA